MPRSLESPLLALVRKGAGLCNDLARLHNLGRPLTKAEAIRAEALPGEIHEAAEAALVMTARRSPGEVSRDVRDLALAGPGKANGLALFAEAIDQASAA